MEADKTLLKDEKGEDVDEHLYRSMIGSLMYLTSSRPDIMFAVCSCARFQVNPKISHLHAAKRIFRYLKGASLDRKCTTRGYQFLGCRLISWQCKKQTLVANSTTKAEYIASSNCYGQTSMAGLTFADSHNMVAYLEKSTENADFAEIVDFLNVNPIRNLDSSKKFLMYPRFLQLFLNNQIENLSEVNAVYDTPSHTKKIFANMRRQGKDFSRKVTPLFETMLIQQQADMGEGSGQPIDPQHTSTSAQPSNKEPIIVPSSSQPKKTFKRRKPKKVTEIPQSSEPTTLVAYEVVHEERGDNMEKGCHYCY
ncbi:hypothetical protein Tco_0098647 [Tanacetum coccineum]